MKKVLVSGLFKTSLACVSSLDHAWRRAVSGRDVQLFDVGTACCSRSSFAPDSQADGFGVGFAERVVRRALCGVGRAVDPVRVCVAGAVAACVLLDSFRASGG